MNLVYIVHFSTIGSKRQFVCAQTFRLALPSASCTSCRQSIVLIKANLRCRRPRTSKELATYPLVWPVSVQLLSIFPSVHQYYQHHDQQFRPHSFTSWSSAYSILNRHHYRICRWRRNCSDRSCSAHLSHCQGQKLSQPRKGY